MFAAASDRAAVVELLAKRGADVKVTSSVIDLNSASATMPRSPVCCSGIRRRRRAAAGAAAEPIRRPAAARSQLVPLAQQNRFDPRAQGKAGIDRQYSAQRADLRAGRPGADPPGRARRASPPRCSTLLDAGADVNQLTRRRQVEPAAHRHDQRAFRRREERCSIAAPIRTWPPTTAPRRSTARSTASGRPSRSTRSRARISIRRSAISTS